MIKNIYKILAVFILMLCLFSSAYAQDNLTVKWGASSTFTDIAMLPTPNATSWDITGGNQQIQITADFANIGASGARTVTVRIPRGFKIIAYAAKKGTPAISGVGQLGLSDTGDAMTISSTLTALDSITDFTAQQIIC